MSSETLFTPLIIEFTNAVISDTALITAQYTEYKLAISTEATSKFGSSQALPQTYVVSVPSDGILKIKLLNSNGRPPKNRYRVKYYADANLIDEQLWTIPQCPQTRTIPVTVTNGVGDVPTDVFDVISITPDIAYTVSQGEISIATDGEYTITYQPALTLNEIVENG